MRKLTTREFIQKSKSIHGDKYDYSKVEYTGALNKVVLKCPLHGEFYQRPNHHVSGKGCILCGKDVMTGKLKDDSTSFSIKSNSVHGNLYDYSKVIYKGSHIKVIIVCTKHGEFKQTPSNHLSGRGCPICCNSSCELFIHNFLLNENIDFMEQHRFSDCRNKRPLPFDFYLPELNACIEYDGEQHFKPIKCFGGIKDFSKRKMNDKIKTEYCKENNIRLIRIKYTDSISDMLKQHL